MYCQLYSTLRKQQQHLDPQRQLAQHCFFRLYIQVLFFLFPGCVYSLRSLSSYILPISIPSSVFAIREISSARTWKLYFSSCQILSKILHRFFIMPYGAQTFDVFIDVPWHSLHRYFLPCNNPVRKIPLTQTHAGPCTSVLCE